MFEEIIKLVVDNGIGIACFVVMLYDHMKAQDKMITALGKMTEALNAIDVRIKGLEDRI